MRLNVRSKRESKQNITHRHRRKRPPSHELPERAFVPGVMKSLPHNLTTSNAVSEGAKSCLHESTKRDIVQRHQEKRPPPRELIGRGIIYSPVAFTYNVELKLYHAQATHCIPVSLVSPLDAACFHVGKNGRLLMHETGDIEYTPITCDSDYFEFSALDTSERRVVCCVTVVVHSIDWRRIAISGSPQQLPLCNPVRGSCTYGTIRYDATNFEYSIDIDKMPQDAVDAVQLPSKTLFVGFASDSLKELSFNVPCTHTAVKQGSGGDFRSDAGGCKYHPVSTTPGISLDRIDLDSAEVCVLRYSCPGRAVLDVHYTPAYTLVLSSLSGNYELIVEELIGVTWKLRALCTCPRYVTRPSKANVRISLRHASTRLLGAPSDVICLQQQN